MIKQFQTLELNFAIGQVLHNPNKFDKYIDQIQSQFKRQYKNLASTQKMLNNIKTYKMTEKLVWFIVTLDTIQAACVKSTATRAKRNLNWHAIERNGLENGHYKENLI